MAKFMVIIDGMQDIQYADLGGKSPHDYGRGDNLIMLENASATGMLATAPEGFLPDTMACMLTLLGQEATSIPKGRSYIESVAHGVAVGDNDLVLRANFVEVKEKDRFKESAANPSQQLKKEMLAYVSEKGYSISPTGSFKNLMVVSDGRDQLGSLTTHPPHQYIGRDIHTLLPSGNRLAVDLADITTQLLKAFHPYTLHFWGESGKEVLPQFTQLHGRSGAVVSGTDVVTGSAIAMGMDYVVKESFTGETDTNLFDKADSALVLAEKNDIVIIHIGGTDEATHRRDPREKAEFIRRIDKELIGYLLEKSPPDTQILLTCDHEALATTGEHTTNPVNYWHYRAGQELSGKDAGVVDGKLAVNILTKAG